MQDIYHTHLMGAFCMGKGGPFTGPLTFRTTQTLSRDLRPPILSSGCEFRPQDTEVCYTSQAIDDIPNN